MRTAILFSGQPRHFDVAYPYIKKNIIDPNNCDVFFHAWFDVHQIGQYYEGASWTKNQDTVKIDTPQRLLELYDPKYFLFEIQKTNFGQSLKDWNEYPKTNGEQISFQNYSMFYSMMKSMDLCRSYEQAHGFKYDCIVRARWDFAPLDVLDLQKYEIHDMSKEIHYADLCRNKQVISDWCFWSNSVNMLYTLNVFNSIDQYVLNEGVTLCGENILTHHIDKIKCSRIPKPVSGYLVRDREFKNREFGASF